MTINGHRVDRSYWVEIIDAGPGLTPEQRKQVGAFVQFDRDRYEQQGLGLGISIARSVAEIAGGRLVLKSGPGGGGLNATLELPCAP